MKPRALLIAVALLWDPTPGAAEALRLSDFQGNGAVVEPAPGPPGAVRVTFLPSEWPNAKLTAGEPWDWSRTGVLALEMKNLGAEPVELGVRIDDDPRADGVRHCRTAQIRLEGGESANVAVAVAGGADPMALGMRGLPSSKAIRRVSAGGDASFNPRHVVAVQFFLHAPKGPTRLEFRSARLEAPPAIARIVDEFGQYTGDDWPGKVHSQAELKQKHEADLARIEARPRPADRDRFGGWAGAPKEAPTGFFRTARRDGRWWLVDPDGAPFFSLGVDCATYGDQATIITGREALFTWLPAEGDPMDAAYGRVSNVHSGPVKEGRTINFYRANLTRLYGRDLFGPWADATHKRLASWGFNTIGNWSDKRLARMGRTPYTATLGVYGEFARISSGDDYWGRMCDPFDPRFVEAARRNAAEAARAFKGDPWCIGYFVDNELSWGGEGERGRVGLALGALGAAAAESPAKAAFVERLAKRYGEVARLNDAWKTDFASWGALAAPWGPAGGPEAWTDAFQDDLRGFVREIARVYFRTIRDALKQADPNHLYLGCRFAWKTPEAIEAAAESCDVLSFNVYKRSVDPSEWTILEKVDKPAIIGEFHFGALDRGMFHTGLVATSSQEERAAAYVAYVESVLDHPSFVGCHWFQLVDEPITGRAYDGENYNIGLLNVADLAYPELTEAARTVHSKAYQRRAGGASPKGPR